MWMLGRHPNIIAGNHFGIFHALHPLYKLWTTKRPYGGRFHIFENIDSETSTPIHFQDLVNGNRLEELLRSTAEAILFSAAGVKDGVTGIAEQTPENLEYLHLIDILFPDAYYLHVIRDPRSTHASMRKAVLSFNRSSSFPTHPIETAMIWSRYMEEGEYARRNLKHYHEVRYEDLMHRGPEELSRIYKWIGLPLPDSDVGKIFGASTLENVKKIKALMPEGFFRQGRTKGWQKELPASHVRLIELVASRWMEKYGYERRYPRPSASSELRLLIYKRIDRAAARHLPKLLRRFQRQIGLIPIVRKFFTPPRAFQKSSEHKNAVDNTYG